MNYNNERTRDYTNAGLPSEQQARPTGNSPSNNIMSSLFGEGGNVYGMQPGGPPRPGMFDMAGPPRPGIPIKRPSGVLECNAYDELE